MDLIRRYRETLYGSSIPPGWEKFIQKRSKRSIAIAGRRTGKTTAMFAKIMAIESSRIHYWLPFGGQSAYMTCSGMMNWLWAHPAYKGYEVTVDDELHYHPVLKVFNDLGEEIKEIRFTRKPLKKGEDAIKSIDALIIDDPEHTQALDTYMIEYALMNSHVQHVCIVGSMKKDKAIITPFRAMFDMMDYRLVIDGDRKETNREQTPSHYREEYDSSYALNKHYGDGYAI